MHKLLFLPFSLVAGLLGGLVARRTVAGVWGLIDTHEPPEAQHRDIPVAKLVLALALEGAIVQAVRGAADHGARVAYLRLTGSWPGDEQPAPADS